MTLAIVSATIRVFLSDGTRRYGVPVRLTGSFFMLQVQMYRDVQIIYA